MTNYINIFTHTDDHFRSQNATSVSLIYLSALECYLLGRNIKLNLSPQMCTSLYGLHFLFLSVLNRNIILGVS